jgi:hypothetical protein
MIGHPVLPDEEKLWALFLPRWTADLKARAAELWELSGLAREYGPYTSFAGTFQANEMIDEITWVLLCAILLDVEDRRRSDRAVGRPRDVITPELGVGLLWFFRRYNKAPGRRSVPISIDGKQEEAGPLFEFIKATIEPVNRHLVENNRKPRSPARIARYGLNERQR